MMNSCEDCIHYEVCYACKILNRRATCKEYKSTADVVEVKHGYWRNDENDYVPMKNGIPQDSCWCSECGEWLVASDEFSTIGNYCPSCGAKMEKGEKKNENRFIKNEKGLVGRCSRKCF